ncbi:thiamine pyrophosphate-requiring protein [Enhydrobacter sp.]|jgi:pyruvate dehydrogenase (quinone)|uniref:thiamine pyrophosphate-requiring protein n=1 Tax=Enhydrobacter sp. TaxID=1894999 RepID=UPI00262ABFD8|nr:thiamine pyrophosphate-requiring protein [Enhydrobacter sp.]WIM12840.1 MAG: thiamine pyrophosphate-binding protein [Enhydrobacter sp.]
MATTVGDFLFARLQQWGVKRVFGYPGDGINGIVSALGRARDTIEFVQVRHEEEAAFMACGHAKFTGEVGVCIATSGPGAIDLLNGLYDARLDHQPVVAIVGQQARSALGGHFQQEVDLLSLFKDVASEFVQVCSAPSQVRHLIDRAVRIARARRTVTAVIFPNDVQEADAVEVPEHAHGTIHTGVDFTWPQVVPGEHDLERAADILNRGEKVAILIGAGAAGAATEVMDVAERLRAGVAKALLGKDVLPDDLPYVTGQIGLLGTKASYRLMQECDTLLMVGSTFPYSEFLPREGQARGVQIDIDPAMLSLRYPMEAALVGDSAATLRALLPRLRSRSDGKWREAIETSARETWREEEEKARLPADPLNPELMFWELSARLPEAAMVTVDTGMSTTFVARALKLRQGMKMAVSGTLATMGPAIPYATAAKFAFPDRPVFAFVGDGAMQMLGLNALVTASKYWKHWADPRFIVAVLNNRDLNMVSWELRALGGSPKVPQTQDVPDFDYAAYARLLGFVGLAVERADDVVPIWREALAARQPVVIDVQADPNVIALPPHTTLEQSKNFFEALAKGDVDRRAILRQIYHQMTL